MLADMKTRAIQHKDLPLPSRDLIKLRENMSNSVTFSLIETINMTTVQCIYFSA